MLAVLNLVNITYLDSVHESLLVVKSRWFFEKKNHILGHHIIDFLN